MSGYSKEQFDGSTLRNISCDADKYHVLYNSLVQADGFVVFFSKLKTFVASTNKTPSVVGSLNIALIE